MNELLNKITQGDCLEVMREIPDKCVDMILCDLPYGTTACKWDTIIPFDELWAQYERVIKDNGAIVLTAAQPFTSQLVNSNLKLFRYEAVWEKDKGTDFGNANRKILNAHENILFFYKKQPTYNRQDFEGKPYVRKNKRSNGTDDLNFKSDNSGVWVNDGGRAPKSVIKINRVSVGGQKPLHPTQKPTELFEFLIRTYTNENEVVLDNCVGSGTTAVAAINTNRQFIGIERESEYVEIGNRRIAEALKRKE
jgi:site-specific DNA-methyltransferase (adenine-specific)